MTGYPRSPPRLGGHLPDAQQRQLARARRQEWATFILRLSVVVALYGALGSSQALHAVWLKSLWSLLPPIAFLIAARIESKPPTPRFPYGFYRAASIAFLTAALALACMGGYLLLSGTQAVIAHRHPGLASVAAAGGWAVWPGWWMIAALAYSAAVPWIIGWRRQALAIALHDKGLYADAAMGRVDWLTGGAAIVGVMGIGLGVPWLDSAATILISLDVIRHGLRHLYTAVCDLIDEVPRCIGSHQLDPLGAEIRDYLRGCDWVADVRVRLREEGRLLAGVALICPYEDIASLARFEAAREHVQAMDWRLLDFHLVPVCDATIKQACDNAQDR